MQGESAQGKSIEQNLRVNRVPCLESKLESGARTQAREAGDHFVEVTRNLDLVILEVAEPRAVPADGFDQGSRDFAETHVNLRLDVRRSILIFAGE